jgi:hypothetical protein
MMLVFSANLRSFSKWFLELVRNIGVVVVLLAFSKKSETWTVWVIAQAAYLALVFSIVTHIIDWQHKKLASIEPVAGRTRFFAQSATIIMLTIVVALLVNVIVQVITSELLAIKIARS